ncbi:MAG: hypothetical protein KGZ85_04360 [Ignavibacterium sp.]|nr:hypothetical protein [Ignavibacterium sp.]
MPYNNISAELKEETKQEILSFLNQITERLPFLINLTPEERQTIPKMGDKTYAFVDKALELATQNPNLVPPYLDVEELKRDFTLASMLRPIVSALNSLTEKLNDTQMAVGSEAYVSALSFYNSSKSAAKSNVPGTDAIVSELAKRFEGQKKRQVTQPKNPSN